jgi:hypothetical protein
LPFGMIWVDDRGAITWANDHQRDFSGRRGCELIGVSALRTRCWFQRVWRTI